MRKASLYKSSNGLQRHDAGQVLHEFRNRINWRSDGYDSLLDIGCGSGDVTIDIILPIMPKYFERLVGCDLSSDMIEYARKKYSYSNVLFKLFDLAVDVESQPLWKNEQFDHITSFYCLMWIRDQQTAVRNFYKLLRPGGDLLVVFIANHPLYDFYKRQSKNNKWAEYMTDVDDFITPYQHSKNPAIEFANLLKKCGFADVHVEMREKRYTFDGLGATKNILKSTNPFIDRLPAQDQKDYLEDLVNRFMHGGFRIDDGEDLEEAKFAPPYKLVVAYAKK